MDKRAERKAKYKAEWKCLDWKEENPKESLAKLINTPSIPGVEGIENSPVLKLGLRYSNLSIHSQLHSSVYLSSSLAYLYPDSRSICSV
jgi:hypothetical protein